MTSVHATVMVNARWLGMLRLRAESAAEQLNHFAELLKVISEGEDCHEAGMLKASLADWPEDDQEPRR